MLLRRRFTAEPNQRMKKFAFPLDPVLRWRHATAEIRKAEFAARARAVAEAERELNRLRAEQIEAAERLPERADGAGLATYADFLGASRRRIAQAEQQVSQRRTELQAAMDKLVAADRDARLLERLRGDRLREWRAESDRELEAFAAESFLNKR